MRAAALELVAAGWAVFPCHWRGDRAKSPLTEHGHHDASRDPDVINTWWSRWPSAMIGAPVPDPMLVIDIDPRNGGSIEALTDLAGGPLPDTLTAWSGRGDGGRHLYFQRPAGPLTSTRLPTGVDLKAAGYCIVPPSVHPASGHPYWWEQHPVAPLPPRLRSVLRPPTLRPSRPLASATPTTGRGLVEWVAGLPIGQINDGLYWAACRAAESGILGEIADDLVAAAARAAGPTATAAGERQSRRTVRSAGNRFGVMA